MLYLSNSIANEIPDNPNSIPVSIFPPVVLERPLKLFGESFRVHISTGLTFSPDLILQVAYGMSLRQYGRSLDGQLDTILDALWRGATKKNKLSATTSTLIKQKLEKFIALGALEKVIVGEEPVTQEPWTSDWETLLQVVKEDRDDCVYLLIERLANIDRAAYLAHKSHASGSMTGESMELLDEHAAVRNLFEVWQQSNLKLLLPVTMLVDVSLQTLAWLELRTQPNCNSDSGSQLLKLLAAGKKPLGHWLLQIQLSANCSNLDQLSAKMACFKLTHHDKVVSHDLLKKWSSGQQLMPRSAGDCVLHSAGNRIDKNLWREYFAAARYLSFLCDLLIAGSCGDEPSWQVVQANLFERYERLYDIERVKLQQMCTPKNK